MGGGGDQIWIGTPEADLELGAEAQSTPCASSHDDDLLMYFHASEAIAYKFTTALERVSASGDHGWMISNDLNISLTSPESG